MPPAPVLVGFSAAGGIVRVKPIGPIIGITAGRITTIKYNPIFAESRKKERTFVFLLTRRPFILYGANYEDISLHQTGTGYGKPDPDR